MEKTNPVEFLGPARRPTERERRILFPCKAGAPPKEQRDALDIKLRVNISLSAAKTPFHMHLYRLNYNKKGILSGLMTLTNTSSMLLPQHWELAIKAVRQVEQDIINTKGD